MRKFDYYWHSKKEWYHMDDQGNYVVNDDAPPEAKESYANYLRQSAFAEEQVSKGLSLD